MTRFISWARTAWGAINGRGSCYGSRTSLSIGLVAVMISTILGIVLGGISGYFGGTIDMIIQRLIELLQSLPAIPIWLALTAAMPRDWSVEQTYFAITIILALIGWTTLAREVRSRFLSLREEDYVVAAKLSGAKESRVVFRHMMPTMYSHIIASVSLAIPVMIISETFLSFLGLGLAAAGDQLGRAAARGAESAVDRPRALAAAARPGRGHYRADDEYDGRRPARRLRPLQPLTSKQESLFDRE